MTRMGLCVWRTHTHLSRPARRVRRQILGLKCSLGGCPMSDLILIADALAVTWPAYKPGSALHLRIVKAPLTDMQREWMEKRGGTARPADVNRTGDCGALWRLVGYDMGWASAVELRQEFGKLDCPTGAYMRTISKQVGDK